MQSENLTLTDSPPFTTARIVRLWCAEPVFFASRELSDTYYTEGAIGNYALAYALGWARSPYRLTGKDTGRPRYREDLTPLSGKRYVLPAWPVENSPSYRFERFNALSDAYWYAMTNNRVATAREDLPLKRTGKKPNTYRPSNFPQTGRLRVIDRGNRFETLVFGDGELPEYVRVGKFTSKVRVETGEALPIRQLPVDTYRCNTYLNSADLPACLELFTFDLMAIPPVSLLKNLKFRGAAWQIGDFIVPANLNFLGGCDRE
ncbi:type I-D CRISPR-associated protein Cas5/Csc1 [Geitlerinema sp. CS-897]|nr:type I-D CRISPR-associated protein Cas5/Csc1 [Geitlerinema sp. CS-897]